MITLLEAVDDFMLAKKAGQRAPATLKWYGALLSPFVRAFGGKHLDDLTMRQIAKWLIAQGGSAHTIYDRDKVLRSFFGWAARAYGIEHPMRLIPIPRLPEPEPKAIEPDDLNRLLEACKSARDTAVLIVLADCGLRASGLISLSIDDVDFAARTIRVREKRDRYRSVPFSLDTERAITAWCKRRPLNAERLFCAANGKPLSYWGLREIVRRLAVRAGFTHERCNLHSLRHFAAREYLKQGGSLPALARILGHKQIDTTVRYYAVFGASELAEVHDAHSPLNSLKGNAI